MKRTLATVVALSGFLLCVHIYATPAPSGPAIIAVGTVSGLYEDFAVQTSAPLENGAHGNLLGGVGSGLAHLGGDWFLALPDRGPNAVTYNSCMDDTSSYITRFHTFHLSLSKSTPGSPLPFVLTPMLTGTTLLSSRAPIQYGGGCGAAGSGVPALNALDHTHYFTGRSDGFNPAQSSTSPFDARLDPESIRVSNDWRHVYISDEYGPYVYEFERASGERTRVFTLPPKFAVTNLSAVGSDEISGNTTGRVANKGMEGLAITPDGRTLVGIMQSPLIQDGGGTLGPGQNVRIVTIDIWSGKVTHEFAYHLDDAVKTTVSDIVAVNNHEFLVDERDGNGRADKLGSVAVFKKIYKVDLSGAQDVSALSCATPAACDAALDTNAVSKQLFLDIVDVLKSDPTDIDATQIPAKLEGIAFGPDVKMTDPITHAEVTRHTLFVGNDNDFLPMLTAPPLAKAIGTGENPNQFFVFAFSDQDLPDYVPQRFRPLDDDRVDRDDRVDHDRDDRWDFDDWWRR